MKKTLPAFFLVLCLVLCACGGKAASPSAPISPQTAGSYPTSDIKATTPSKSEAALPSGHITDEEYSYYPTLEKMEKISLGNEYEDAPFFILNEKERGDLWPLMRINEWVVASDLPISGYSSEFYISEASQIWFFNQYDDKILVVPSSSDKRGEKVCYFAPPDVISDIQTYLETLTPQ